METILNFLSPISTFLVEWIYLILSMFVVLCFILSMRAKNEKTETLSTYVILSTTSLAILLFLFSFRVSENEFAIESSLFLDNKKLKIVKERGIHFSLGQAYIFSKGPIEINSYDLCRQMFDSGSEPVCKTKKYTLSPDSFDIKHLDSMSSENTSGQQNTKRVLVYFAKIKQKEPGFVLPTFVNEIKE